jgi:hypothetical protein
VHLDARSGAKYSRDICFAVSQSHSQSTVHSPQSTVHRVLVPIEDDALEPFGDCDCDVNGISDIRSRTAPFPSH